MAVTGSELTLIAHCGPMKTGSSAIQAAAQGLQNKLSAHAIRFWHYGTGSDFAARLPGDIEQAARDGISTLLISSEFLGFRSPKAFSRALAGFEGRCHAIMVHRPLRDLYPSLYLQNIKGPTKRSTTFEAFVEDQGRRDADPRGVNATTFNFGFLDDNMRAAGFEVHWLDYSRNTLLARFFDLVGSLHGTSLEISDAELTVRPPGPLSPIRSLNMALAPVACEINRLHKDNVLTQAQRTRLMAMMQDVSEKVEGPSPAQAVPAELLDRIDRLDDLINADFRAALA